MLPEESRVLNRVPLNRRQRFRSIGHARSVAKINKALVRQMFMQGAIDCQSTYAAVEDTDGKPCDFGFRILDCGIQVQMSIQSLPAPRNLMSVRGSTSLQSLLAHPGLQLQACHKAVNAT